MKIGVLGTGVVGETIASALIKKDHYVMLGSRKANNEKLADWVKSQGDHASQGTFRDAAAYGDLLFICLNGAFALDVLEDIDEDYTRNKIVIDMTNPLDFSKGMPPRILDGLGNTNSLGEEIQRALPHSFVVKTLNTVNCKVMVDARIVNNGDHNLFLCGNSPDAKNKTMHFLVDNFHWRAKSLIDLGGIEMSRCAEGMVPFWVSVMQAVGGPLFNFKIVQ